MKVQYFIFDFLRHTEFQTKTPITLCGSMICTCVYPAVQGAVGATEQRWPIQTVTGIERDPDTGGNGMAMPLDGYGQGQFNHDAPGYLFGQLGIAIEQDRRELIAAQPGNRVGFAHTAVKAPGRFNQDAVANVMPQGVVDRFEIVQIDIKQCDLGFSPAGLRARA